jgi:hypothetical protein
MTFFGSANRAIKNVTETSQSSQISIEPIRPYMGPCNAGPFSGALFEISSTYVPRPPKRAKSHGKPVKKVFGKSCFSLSQIS